MNDERRLHGALIGKAGSRNALNTPVLVIDIDAFERNVARMAALARTRGVALRPHAKTHKSVEIAKRQIAAGAVGVCCAKLGEAEALAEGGVTNILITSPVVSAPAIARLVALNRQVQALAVVLDNPANARALSAALGKERLSVFIDIDPGIRRTGVASPEAAVELYRQVRDAGNLDYRGVQFYCGVHQHIAAYEMRKGAIAERTGYLQTALALLEREGAPRPIVTGSGTGTHRIDAELGVFGEWQVGSYIFMDRQYAECELGGTAQEAYEYALFVDARVVSCNTQGMATIDAGFKALATDGGVPVVVSGAPPGANYHFMGDEHGAIVDPEMAHRWAIGDVVRLAVPHCDPTVNLYDAYHVVSGETLVDIWPVSARGRSR